MSTFTASNGVKIKPEDGNGAMVSNVQLLDEEMDAAREFFQAEQDERLGRWRYPKDFRYIVYPLSSDEVRVVDEETGATFTTRRPTREHPAGQLNHALGAAVAYFAAHPEPKPEWHGAKENEVWVLKTERGFTLPMICQADAFRDHAGMFPLDSDEILEAHRIWSPEE